MSLKMIEAHRRRYAGWTYGDSYAAKMSPWRTAWEEMGKKTPCRRLAKRCPLSVEFQNAAMLDELGEAGLAQHLPQPAIEGQLALPPAELNRSKSERLAEEIGGKTEPPVEKAAQGNGGKAEAAQGTGNGGKMF
jgi:recombinational DNA repair protein RecT